MNLCAAAARNGAKPNEAAQGISAQMRNWTCMTAIAQSVTELAC